MIAAPCPIIGITGAAGAGKDLAGALLVQIAQAAGIEARCSGFADPIRAMLAGIIEPRYMTQRELKESPIPTIGYSYRDLAQTLGTEYGRELMPGLWIRIKAAQFAAAAAEAGRTAPLLQIITDCRFCDEAAWVRAQGGRLLRIDRPGVAGVRPHSSESGWLQMRADEIILNDAGVELLQLRLEQAFLRVMATPRRLSNDCE